MDDAKKIKGRKRHILVDTQGLLLQTKIIGANLSDKEGVISLLAERKEMNLKKIWGDNAYQGEDLKERFLKCGIDLEVVKRPPGRKRIYNEQWRAEWVAIPREFNILPKKDGL